MKLFTEYRVIEELLVSEFTSGRVRRDNKMEGCKGRGRVCVFEESESERNVQCIGDEEIELIYSASVLLIFQSSWPQIFKSLNLTVMFTKIFVRASFSFD